MKLLNSKRVKFSVVYNRTNGKRLNADGKALIQIRCYQDGHCKFISTGILVAPKYWDKKNTKVKNSEPHFNVYNQKIRDILEQLEEFEIRMVQRFGFSCLAHLKSFEENKGGSSFTQFCAEELERPEIKGTTRRGQRYSLKVMASFQKEISFGEIDLDFVTRFDRFMIRRGLGTNTIHKHHRCLKRYVNMAIRGGFIDANKNPYVQFKPKLEEPNRAFLTAEELAKIENVEIPESVAHMGKIRQIFLLACYTGLRFGDLCRLCYAHTEETTRGMQLNLRTEKNNKPFRLPLWLLFRRGNTADYSEPEKLIRAAIAEQRNIHRGKLPENIPFFHLSNQYFNRGLKDLAKLAGINKKLSSHMGRRTFATLLATRVKVPVLQRLLNHSKIDITMLYVQLSNQVIEQELEGINWSF